MTLPQTHCTMADTSCFLSTILSATLTGSLLSTTRPFAMLKRSLWPLMRLPSSWEKTLHLVESSAPLPVFASNSERRESS